MKRLPNSILYAKKIIQENTPIMNVVSTDGRINSTINEINVINVLTKYLGYNRIKIPKNRMWYDILIRDFRYGWLPVNIKITTAKTADNACNIAGLVQSYTNVNLNYEKYYNNGIMSKLLLDEIKKNNINKTPKKDYYFLIFNKTNNKCYVNSIRGLTELTPNINNLPFQIKWILNETFNYKHILDSIRLFFDLYVESKNSWKEHFLNEIKNKGQYFTTSLELCDVVTSFVRNNPSVILEPSIGRGDLVNLFSDIPFVMYEIDDSIRTIPSIDRGKIIFQDFLKADITERFDTIIGNPPFVKNSSKNLYIQFTEKCVDLLNDNGELIFIIPSEFFKVTSASTLLKRMCDTGSFTHIYHPHNENLFKDATIDVLVFRYMNGEKNKSVLYNDELMYVVESHGVITFEYLNNENDKMFKDYFDIKVGIVSGMDKVFKNDIIGRETVLVGKNKFDNFIITDIFPTSDESINEYLMENKNKLMTRRIKKFDDTNWFKWGAMRNIEYIEQNFGQECIYIHNITRHDEIAFIGMVGKFGGNLLMMKPKNNKTIVLQKIVSYLNSTEFKRNYIFSGRFKIGHKQLCYARICITK
jgi:adenine-specific DNA-methyltransferase